MGTPHIVTEPLISDAERQADATIRGFYYQFLVAVDSWIKISSEEALYLEMAEDIEISAPDSSAVTQIKDRVDSLSLGRQDATSAINNFWALRTDNRERKIQFRYLSTGGTNVERSEPFGEGVSGVVLWNRTKRGDESVGRIRDYLLRKEDLSGDLRTFLSTETDDSIYDELISRIVWITDGVDIATLSEQLKSQIAELCHQRGVGYRESLGVFHELVHQVQKTAALPDNRKLTKEDFYRILEEASTVRVPRREFDLLKKIPDLAVALHRVPDEQLIPIYVVRQMLGKLPQLDSRFSKRTGLVDDINSLLDRHGVAVIQGSSGMGKSVISTLALLSRGKSHSWIRCSGLHVEGAKIILSNIEAIINEPSSLSVIVFDDFNFDAGFATGVQDYLAEAIKLLRQRDIRVLISTQRRPTNQYLAVIGCPTSAVTELPRLAEDDLRELLRNHGYMDETDLQIWSTILLAKTSGHPQLAHARVLSLMNSGCPKPNVDALLQPAEDIEQVKASARQMLMGELPDIKRELVYRLSIFIGSFRRTDALELGAFPPEIASSADLFDWLVGPWIEHVTGRYYRLSPLIANSATEVYPKSRQTDLHKAAAQSILRAGDLTTHEAACILFHAILWSVPLFLDSFECHVRT